MAGPTETTPILNGGDSKGSEHFPEQEFQGHGNRMSTSRRSTRKSADVVCDDNESIVDWAEAEEGDSDFSALMNLVTGAIGSGVVFLPAAAADCGLFLGLIIICVCGFVSAHSTTIIGTVLLMARNLGKKKGFGKVVETFEDISDVCWGKIGFWIISFINYLDLYLTVAVFTGTLASVFNNLLVAIMNHGKDEADQTKEQYWWYLVGVLGWGLAVLPLCLLKSMDAISKMSILGVVANGIILICIIISACEDKTEFNADVKQCYDWANDPNFNFVVEDDGSTKVNTDLQSYVNELWPDGKVGKNYFNLGMMWGAYGNFAFSFAVAVVAPSIVVGMRNPKHLGRVVWMSHFIITGIYAAIIVVSWFGWGNGISTCELKDIKVDGVDRKQFDFNACPTILGSTFIRTLWVQIIAVSCLIISIMSSIPLFFFSIATMVEGQAKQWWPNMNEFAFRLLNRTVLLLICIAPALAVGDKLGAFQGFTGAVTTTTICSILPNLLYFCFNRQFPLGHIFRGGKMGFMILCAFCLAFGIFSLVVGFMADGLELFGAPSPFDKW